MPPEFNFSKSKYCEYWQCPKMAWLRQHLPDKAEEDPSAVSRMEAGRNVEEITRGLFGDYVDVSAYKDGKPDLAAMEAATIRAMQRGVPTICGASFCYNGLFCAVDILKQENGGWAIYEVKSGTKPTKGVYIADVAYQLYVLECLKIPVTGVYIVSLDRNYIFDGKLKPRKLFKITDVTDKARAETNIVYNNLLQAIKLLPCEEEPDIPISRACKNPYPCPFRNYCSSELPTNTNKNPRPEYIDKASIKRFLTQLHYPLYFLDVTIQSRADPTPTQAPYYCLPTRF